MKNCYEGISMAFRKCIAKKNLSKIHIILTKSLFINDYSILVEIELHFSSVHSMNSIA